MVSPKASLINDEFASFGLGAWYVPTPKAPTCMTLPESVPTFFVALLPKPTFYRLPCGSHADNFT
ncbi:Uncharacterised protein [Enterobacter hormaechei]|nr:Uncharacterised protein [Enterobacter hormaechei]